MRKQRLTKRQLSEGILQELQRIHYHQDRMEVLFMLAHGIKADETGVWIEGAKEKKIGLAGT